MFSRAHELLAAFSLRPFVKNAKHTLRDIQEIIESLSIVASYDHEIERRAAKLRRLREGIRWVFVLDALERGIIFPLSYLLDDLLRAERVKRRKTKEKGRVVITSSLAPEKFADIRDRITDFKLKLGKCKDDILAHPVKSEVLVLLTIAEAHIAEDDWRLVKQDLDAIAEIL